MPDFSGLTAVIDLVLAQLAPQPPTASFTTLRAQIAGTPPSPARDAALRQGIASAVGWRRALANLTTRGAGPVPTLRARVEAESGTSVDVNPLLGVAAGHVEYAYSAFAAGAVTEPWVLLALWVKEGLTNTESTAFTAASAENARVLWRSSYYYSNMGLDYFTHYTEVPGSDNIVDLTDAGAAAHQHDFRTRVREQFQAGRLPRDISAEIDAEIVATPDPVFAGTFNVTARPGFYSLSLLLADARFRDDRRAAAADARVGPDPDIGLVYMCWNLGRARFMTSTTLQFLASAGNHRMEAQYALSDGSHPTIAQWPNGRSSALRFRESGFRRGRTPFGSGTTPRCTALSTKGSLLDTAVPRKVAERSANPPSPGIHGWPPPAIHRA